MLTPEEYAALMDILQRHVQGRLSAAEALALNAIIAKLAPKADAPAATDEPPQQQKQKP